MEDSKQTRLHMNPIDEPRPQPIFANHMVTRGMGDYVVFNFYSALFTQPKAPDEELPSDIEMDAHLMAQIVVPMDRWNNLIDNIIERRQAAPAKEEGS